MNKKKLLALLMALVMTLTLVPVTALAEQGGFIGTGENPSNPPTTDPPFPIPSVENVAQIGEDTYTSFVQAVAAANIDGNCTIKILADIDFSQGEYADYKWAGSTYNPIEITGENVVLDLNNHRFYNMGNAAIAIGHLLAAAGRTENVTVMNGSLEAGQTGGVTNSYVLGIAGADNAKVINVDTDGGINIYTGSTATITNSTINGTKYYAVCAQTGSNVTIENSTITKNTDSSVANKAMFWVDKAGTDSDCITSINPTGAFDASAITIKSGSFTVDSTNGGVFYLTSGIKPVVEGGTFNFDPSAYVTDEYKVTNNNDGTWTVSAKYVAKIGETKYETLQEAFNAAQSGDIVELLQNVDATGAMYSGDDRFNLWINKSITLDGAGYTLTVKGRGIGVQGTSDNIDVTIKNITVKNTGNVNGRCVDTRGKLNSLTLENATLTTAESSYSSFLQPLTIGGNQNSTTTVTIKDSRLTTVEAANKGYAITTFNPVNMTVSGSTIKGWACFNLKGADNSAGSAGSTITVSDSTLVSANGTPGDTNSYCLIKIEDDNINVTITDTVMEVSGNDNLQSIVSFQKPSLTSSANCVVSLGDKNKVTLEGDYGFASNMGDFSELSISGGIFNEYVPKFFCAEGYFCVANTDPNTVNAYPYMVTTEGTLVAEVLRPDEENPGFYRYVGGYATLQAAIDAVPADGTETIISMIGDETIVGNDGVTIPTTKNVVLDLDGHTIKNAVNEDKASQVITNRGTLTIMDSTGTGLITNAVQEGTKPGEWWSTPRCNYVTNVITNSGTLTVESGTIRQTAAGSICYAVDNNSTSYDTILNVEGGLITDDHGTVVRMFCNSITNKNIINITGGEITTPGKAAIWTQLPGSNATSMKQAELNIIGGSVSGGTYAWYDYSFGDGWDNVNYSFTGGQLKGLVETEKANGAYQFISGGIYSVKPDAKYICDGYAAMANEDPDTSFAYPYKVDMMTVEVEDNPDATVTVEQKSNLVTDDANNQTAIEAYTSAVTGASIATENAVTVSGVVLSADPTVDSGNEVKVTGIQAVVDAAKTKAEDAGNDDFTSSLNSASTVKIDVDVKVTPKEYDTTNKKVLTFDLTPYATVTVTKEDETPVSVDGVEVTNDMIDQDQPIFVKLYTGVEPKVLLHICDKTTESLTKGSEATLNTFKYDDADGYCEFYVSHFSDIKAILPESSEGGFLEIDGGSLRRRVLTDNPNSVINYATDLRLRFKINLPEGAEIVQGDNKSYFDWGLDESMSYRATLTSTSEDYAALIINRVKVAQFNTEIYCQLHLTYRLDNQEYTMVCGPMHRSVNYIATAMADTTDGSIKEEWINYGRFLLGREGYGTYDLNDYQS